MKSLCRIQFFATPRTVAYQAPQSMEFSRQECWSGLLFPSPGDLPGPKDRTLVSHIAGRRFTVWATREVCIVHGILQARILEHVAVPFSRESSQPRNGTQVSYIAGAFCTSLATREAHKWIQVVIKAMEVKKTVFGYNFSDYENLILKAKMIIIIPSVWKKELQRQ